MPTTPRDSDDQPVPPHVNRRGNPRTRLDDGRGIGPSKSYELAKSGEFPVQVLRVGRRCLVPVPSILAALGVE